MEGVDIKDNKRWQEFNSIVDSKELDIKEKGLLLILFRYVNYKTGYADPSREKIKELSQISNDETLDKILKSLIKKGYLERISGKGAKIRSRYYTRIPIKNIGIKNIPIENIPMKKEGGIPIKNKGIIPIKNGGLKEKENKIKEYIYMDLTFIDDVIDKVKIMQGQYDKLVNKFDSSIVNNQILALDNYIANGKGNKYKDHYRVLNTWCIGKKPKEIIGQMKIEDMF